MTLRIEVEVGVEVEVDGEFSRLPVYQQHLCAGGGLGLVGWCGRVCDLKFKVAVITMVVLTMVVGSVTHAPPETFPITVPHPLDQNDRILVGKIVQIVFW